MVGINIYFSLLGFGKFYVFWKLFKSEAEQESTSTKISPVLYIQIHQLPQLCKQYLKWGPYYHIGLLSIRPIYTRKRSLFPMTLHHQAYVCGLGLLEILRVPTEIAKHSVSVQPTEFEQKHKISQLP